MKRKVLAMLLLVALLLSALAPAATAQPETVQPLSGNELVWDGIDQTISVGTQYVDVVFEFDNPGVTFTQVRIDWDANYLRLPTPRTVANVLRNVTGFGTPTGAQQMLDLAPAGGPWILSWDHGTGVTANGSITVRLEVITENVLASLAAAAAANEPVEVIADVTVSRAGAVSENWGINNQVVTVVGDTAEIRIVDLSPVPMWFDGNGGGPAIQPVVASVGDSVTFGTLITDPTVVIPIHPDGYEFLGWARTADALPADIITATTIWNAQAAEDYPVVFAVWGEYDRPHVVRMNFRGNGGEPVNQAVDAFIIVNETTFGNMNTDPRVVEPTREDYRFIGWSLSEDGSTGIIPNDAPWTNAIIQPSYRTVWAQWVEGDPIYQEYIAIAFYGNGGTPREQTILADRVDDGPEYELRMADLDPVERAHHTFLGWFSAPIGGVNLDDIDPFLYSSPRVFYARWRAIGAGAPMIFDANGGYPALQPVMAQVGPAIQFGTMETTPRVVIPTHPNDYEFLGWARTADALPADIITATTIWNAQAAEDYPVVFAVWGEPTIPPTPFPMTFDGNFGSPAEQSVVAMLRPGMTFGTLDTNPVVMEPIRAGFTFDGWSETVDGPAIPANTLWTDQSADTVYARWIPGDGGLPLYITLAFYGNGGTPTHQAVLARRLGIGPNFEVLDDPSDPEPERLHHVFLGWYSECGLNFEDIDPFTFISPRVFFAQWRTDTTGVPMIFDGNSGTPDLQPVVAQIGNGVLWGEMVASGTTPRVVTPQHPNNYAFLGWARTADALPADIIAADTVWNAAAYATLTNNTVFAVWGDPTTRPIEVEMNFMGNGGNPVDQEVTAFIRATTTFATLDTDPVVMEPSRTGHTFLGWSLTQDGDIIPPNTLWLPAATDANYRTVWAQWEETPRTYPPITIAFYGNGNTEGPDHQAILANPISGGPNYTLVSQPLPVLRTNYEFLGWYSDCGLNFDDIDPFTFISPRVFRARWEGDTEPMAMWFVGNGGNPAEQVVTAQVGEGMTFSNLVANGTYPRVVTPLHPNGYEFLGWSTTEDGTSGIILPGAIWTDESPRIVYAQWDPEEEDPRSEIPMTFRGNTGNAADDQAVMVFVTQGMTFGTLDTNPVVVRPERTGYRFLGWSRTQAAGSAIIPANTPWTNVAFLTSYRTVWAQWAAGDEIFPDYVEVAFHGNGGSPARQPILAELTDASTFMTYLVEQPYTPERYGYTFLGWFTAPVDGDRLEEGRPLTFHGQREFWAQWESNSIPMWFVGNGGQPENQVVTVLIDPTTTFGTLTTNPRVVNPFREGYIFLGWSEDEDGTSGIIAATEEWTETSPRVVFAQWEEGNDPRFVVPMVFVSNNLTLPEEVQAVQVFATAASTFGDLDMNPVVERPTHLFGLRFLGWSMTRNGSTGIIADDAPWGDVLNPGLPQFRRVYAQWGPGPEVYPDYIAIGFHANGGTDPEHQVILANLYDGAEFFGSLQETVLIPDHPQDLDFLHWGTAPTGGDELEAGDPITYDGPRVFYAQWERFFLEFRFDGDNNSTVVVDPSEEAFIRIPVTPGEPIDWELTEDHEYIYEFGDRISTGLPAVEWDGVGTLVQGWALWGWFDDVRLAYGEANRGFDTRTRPMVGEAGWDLSDETTFVFDEQDFEDLGNGTVIRFTAIFSLWGDANDDDQVTAADVLLINQYLVDRAAINADLVPPFQLPLNLRASNVTVPANRVVVAADVLRINQYLVDRAAINAELNPPFRAVLGSPIAPVVTP